MAVTSITFTTVDIAGPEDGMLVNILYNIGTREGVSTELVCILVVITMQVY